MKPAAPCQNEFDFLKSITAAAPLSLQENRVMACRARGLTYKETSSALGVSINTVKFHLRHIFAKTGARSSAQAIFQLSRFRPSLAV